jgi:hypothetical protein
MNIIFDTDHIESIKNNNVLLELDTFYFSKLNKTVTAYCVIENVKITDLSAVEQNISLHNQLIEAYKKRDFKLCEDLADSLTGCFNGEVDSFYQDLITRTKTIDLTSEWNPVIHRED